jgi:hypothetical protein
LTRPSATSSAAITPTDFCASFDPCPKARLADVPQLAARTGPRQRRVPRRPARRRPRIATSPAAAPSRGEIASATSVPTTPTGRQPSKPPQSIAPAPPAATPAPTRPPTSACPELAGRPRAQVKRFHITAEARPAAITAIPVLPSAVTIPPTVSATAAPRSSGPSRLNAAASSAACSGRAARVATSAAIALDASCSPFVTANASASAMASANPAFISSRRSPPAADRATR